MDFEDRPIQRQGHHQAHVDEITLQTADDFQYGVGGAFDIGPSDGIGSNDFNDFDLGIDWEGDPKHQSDQMSVGESIGVGREAPVGLDSLDPDVAFGDHIFAHNMDALSHRSKSRELSVHPFDHPMDDLPEASGFDLSDIGIGFGDVPFLEEPEKGLGQAHPSRACESYLWR